MHSEEPTRLIDVLTRPSRLWPLLCDYLGLQRLRRRRAAPIDSPAALQDFLQARASYVAQTSLYGYLRTRAGMRYPELFDADDFVVSINIAKWQLWLACLSDLAVYAGGLMLQRVPHGREQVAALLPALVDNILRDTGTPADAGAEFADSAARVRSRLAQCRWTDFSDDGTVFTESPAALVRWAPIVDELKQLDEEIVSNSVRFRWQEVRRDLRHALRAAAVMGIEQTLDA